MSTKRTVLQTLPVPNLPGWELRVIMLEFPPGVSVAAHTHPVSGISYIVEGQLISQYEGQAAAETYGAGDSFIDHKDTLHHRAENASFDKPLRMVISYVVKEGEPTTVMV